MRDSSSQFTNTQYIYTIHHNTIECAVVSKLLGGVEMALWRSLNARLHHQCSLLTIQFVLYSTSADVCECVCPVYYSFLLCTYKMHAQPWRQLAFTVYWRVAALTHVRSICIRTHTHTGKTEYISRWTKEMVREWKYRNLDKFYYARGGISGRLIERGMYVVGIRKEVNYFSLFFFSFGRIWNENGKSGKNMKAEWEKMYDKALLTWLTIILNIRDGMICFRDWVANSKLNQLFTVVAPEGRTDWG